MHHIHAPTTADKPHQLIPLPTSEPAMAMDQQLRDMDCRRTHTHTPPYLTLPYPTPPHRTAPYPTPPHSTQQVDTTQQQCITATVACCSPSYLEGPAYPNSTPPIPQQHLLPLTLVPPPSARRSSVWCWKRDSLKGLGSTRVTFTPCITWSGRVWQNERISTTSAFGPPMPCS